MFHPLGTIVFAIPPVATHLWIPQVSFSTKSFSIEFFNVSSNTTSDLWCCRGWYIEGEWWWGDSLRIRPSERKRRIIVFPEIPELMQSSATLQKIEFEKVWEGYRKSVKEKNWSIRVQGYNE